MNPDHTFQHNSSVNLEAMGAGAITYIRTMTAEEIADKFQEVPDLQEGKTYWALFNANGAPILLAGDQSELLNAAFYNNLVPLQPN